MKSGEQKRQGTHLIVSGRRVVTVQGVRQAAVLVRDGVIADVVAPGHVPSSWPADSAVYDAGDSVVMPGLVDTHVHMNEPGRTSWEGFDTGTRAAAAGGTTTVVDMPLNSIPATTTADGLRAKQKAASGKCWVDTGFWGGVVPGNGRELEKLHNAGVLGFKCFLVPSGVDEFPAVAEGDLRAAFPVLARLGSVLQAHAEIPGPIEAIAARIASQNPARYATWLKSRPAAAESQAIALLIELVREYGTRVHIVHLSDAGSVPQLRRARKSGLPITVETCPHYLFFNSSAARDTRFKCAPPIRGARNQSALWKALRGKIIDFVVSDHSPCPPEMKRIRAGDFFRAWGGIASVELRLPVIWTASRRRGFGFTDLTRWLASEPARMAGLEGRKGALAKGYDADITVWNPEARFLVKAARLQQRHKETPYAEEQLSGKVEVTFVRGLKVFEHGRIQGEPSGALIERRLHGKNGSSRGSLA